MILKLLQFLRNLLYVNFVRNGPCYYMGPRMLHTQTFPCLTLIPNLLWLRKLMRTGKLCNLIIWSKNRQNKIILERAREFNDSKLAEKLQNKRAIILSHPFSLKLIICKFIRSTTQNKTYQLWCFIFLQTTYFAILH